ncbi:MAG: transposase [Bacteroidetes bacterium]|nr:MAG: transposase [Bacteroidota bacterium]
MVNDGERLFGKIENGKIILSEAGKIIGKHWKKVPVVYPNTSLDEFVVMPDHFHAILQIKTRVERVTVGNILKSFKSFSAQEVNVLLGRQGNRLWQRNYYDRILKTQKDVERIRWYSRQNPAKWDSEQRLTAEI